MSDDVSRRRILQATAASGVAVSLAGCTGSLLGDSACDVGEDLITALYDGAYEEAASYAPHEYDDELDEDELADAYEFMFEMGDAGELEAVSCDCSESVDEEEIEAANEEGELDAEVEDAKELRYEVEAEIDGEAEPHSMYLSALEIDGDWYVMPGDEDEFDSCAE